MYDNNNYQNNNYNNNMMNYQNPNNNMYINMYQNLNNMGMNNNINNNFQNIIYAQYASNPMPQANNNYFIGRSNSDKPNNINLGPSYTIKDGFNNNSSKNLNKVNKNENKPNTKKNKIKIDYGFLSSKDLDKGGLNINKPEIDNENPLISQKLNELFCDQNLSNINSEQDLLNFFTEKEKECTEFIDNSFKENTQLLKLFMNKKISEIFNNNLKINVISKDILIKIEEVDISKFSNEKEYFDKMKELFGEAKLPLFLIKYDLLRIKSNNISQNRNLETTTIIGKIKNREFSHKNLIEYYESFREGQSKPLSRFKSIKTEILYLFISVNCKIFQKSYCREPFLTFFEANENILKEYFGNNIKYCDIANTFLKLKEKQAINEIQKNFEVVEKDLKGEDDLYNIISSFYYLLLNKFKDTKQPKSMGISNILVNLTLTNFVIFLDQRLKQKLNLAKSQFDSLKELYLYDLIDLISKGLCRKTNNLYDYEKIDEALLKNESVNKKYEELKKQFPKPGVLTLVKKNLDHRFNQEMDLNDFEKNLKLIPVEKNIYSNTITIIVNGFSMSEDALLEEWKEFVNYFPKETMFYFFKSGLDTKLNLLSDGTYKKMKKAIKKFKEIQINTKLLGSLLALILYSKTFFRGFQINLVGYSFGNMIIKQCLIDLYKMNNQNNFIKIKNVIFIGAPINFDDDENWKSIIESLILDRLINCFSQADEVLANLFKINMGEKIALGNKFTEIFNDNGENIISNYNFTQNQFNQFNYEKGLIAESIFPIYKDI